MGKKQDALQSDSYKEDLIFLINMGIKEDFVQRLVDILKGKEVCVTRDTAVKKIIELLLYVRDIRNKGIPEKSPEFITPELLLEKIIAKNPKGVMERDSRKFEEICETIESFSWTTPKKVNQILLASPVILGISAEKLARSNAILSNFKVKKVDEKQRETLTQMSEFVFINDSNCLKTSPEKLFARLAYFANISKNRTMLQTDYYRLMKSEPVFQRMFGVSTQELMRKYPLPTRDDEFADNIYSIITEYQKEEQECQSIHQWCNTI